MRKFKLNLTFLFLIICFSTIAQDQNSTDSIYKFGSTFRQNNKILKPNQMLQIMEEDSAAYKQMKSALNNYRAGNAIGAIGGFMFGWPLGAVAGGGQFNLPLFATGLVIASASLPFSISYSKKAIKAVKIYNSNLGADHLITENFKEHNTMEKRENIFHYSRYSKLKSEVCLYVNGEKKACMTPGNYYRLSLPLHSEVDSIMLRSEHGDCPLSPKMHNLDSQLFLFKFKKDNQLYVDRVSEGTKREITGAFKEQQEVKSVN
jgi:hypothetical protein